MLIWEFMAASHTNGSSYSGPQAVRLGAYGEQILAPHTLAQYPFQYVLTSCKPWAAFCGVGAVCSTSIVYVACFSDDSRPLLPRRTS